MGVNHPGSTAWTGPSCNVPVCQVVRLADESG